MGVILTSVCRSSQMMMGVTCFPHTLHTSLAVSQSSAVKPQTGAVAQQRFNANVFLAHPTVTQASAELELENRLFAPRAFKPWSAEVETRPIFTVCFQFTVSGFGGFLIGSLRCFVFGQPRADLPLSWHWCRPFLWVYLWLSVSPFISPLSLSLTCSDTAEARGRTQQEANGG